MKEVGFASFVLIIASLLLLTCVDENAKIENENISTGNTNVVSEKENTNDNPKIKAIYINSPIYYFDDFSKDEKAKLSYKTVVFFENGEWGRIYTYTGKNEEGKFISLDTSEGVEYGIWEKEDNIIKIHIKKCKCKFCFEGELLDKLSNNRFKVQKTIVENWKIENGLGSENSLLKFEDYKYKLLKKEGIRLNGFENRIYEPLNIDNDWNVPCNILEN